MITLTDPNASTPTVFPSQINITGGAWANNIFNLDVSKSTTTSKYYELNTYTNNGFEFRNEAGNTVVYPNTDDNTGQPNYVSFSNPITSDSRFGVSSIESLTLTSSDVGSTLHLYASHDNSLWMSFVVSTDLIFTYEAPAYRTGTSQGFAFTSGIWKGYGYTAVIDDEANSSSGKLVNGVRQWEWDMPDIGGGRLYSGANNWIYFVPGTAEDNGTWYHSSTSTGGTAGTRNGRVISIGTSATFDETNAFVDGLVPYGDIP